MIWQMVCWLLKVTQVTCAHISLAIAGRMTSSKFREGREVPSVLSYIQHGRCITASMVEGSG